MVRVKRGDEDSISPRRADRYEQYDGRLPIWTSFESESFHASFGRFADQLPGAGLPVGDSNLALGRIAADVRDAPGVVIEPVMLVNLNDEAWRFAAEGFFNQYSVFNLRGLPSDPGPWEPTQNHGRRQDQRR